jgi:hypothetical protein
VFSVAQLQKQISHQHGFAAARISRNDDTVIRTELRDEIIVVYNFPLNLKARLDVYVVNVSRAVAINDRRSNVGAFLDLCGCVSG